MKKQVPEKTSEAVDANLRKPGEEATTKNNDGTPVEGLENDDRQSKQSNALSNDLRGSTQFVNLDTSEVPEGNHEQPDAENTVDRPAPTAETHLANNEPLDKTDEDKTINTDSGDDYKVESKEDGKAV